MRWIALRSVASLLTRISAAHAGPTASSGASEQLASSRARSRRTGVSKDASSLANDDDAIAHARFPLAGQDQPLVDKP